MVRDDAMVQTQNPDGKNKREWIMNQWHHKDGQRGDVLSQGNFYLTTKKT
jgi:hypothetical protein